MFFPFVCQEKKVPPSQPMASASLAKKEEYILHIQIQVIITYYFHLVEHFFRHFAHLFCIIFVEMSVENEAVHKHRTSNFFYSCRYVQKSRRNVEINMWTRVLFDGFVFSHFESLSTSALFMLLPRKLSIFLCDVHSKKYFHSVSLKTKRGLRTPVNCIGEAAVTT
jgi:hypothetical protein